MREKIRAIKQQFRLSMNGVVSQNMREHGMNYKVNFGLTLPLLKRIAEETGRNAELAQALWEETTVRESMMIAPLLYPIEELSADRADEWVADLPNTEVADMCSKYLFCKAEFALQRAAAWSQSEKRLSAYAAFQTATALLINNPEMAMSNELEAIVASAIAKSESSDKGVVFAALVFLKQAVHNPAIAPYLLSEHRALPEKLSMLLHEERELFLEFSKNDSH